MAASLKLVTLALGLCTACGSPAARARTTKSEPRLQALIKPEIAPDTPAAMKDLGVVGLPPRPICALDPQPWTGSVSLRRGGQPFATINLMRTTVSLAAEEEERWGVASVETKVATLHGVVAPPPLFLKKPTALGGFVIPASATSFVWAEAVGAANAVNITLDLTGVFAAPPLLKEQVPCADLALSSGSYDPRELLGAEALKTVGTVGGDVELRLAPTTPPVAKTATAARMAVFVLKSGTLFSRVLLDIGSGYAFGWIESRHINRASFNGGRLRTGGIGVRDDVATSNRCFRDLQLVAEIAGERAVIGSLKAGAAFDTGVESETGKLTSVAPNLWWLSLEKGATLWVPTSELRACGTSRP